MISMGFSKDKRDFRLFWIKVFIFQLMVNRLGYLGFIPYISRPRKNLKKGVDMFGYNPPRLTISWLVFAFHIL